jgi:IS1 family transposase
LWQLFLPQTTKYRTRFKPCNLSTDHWKQYSKLIPNYKNLSSNQFKDLLIESIPLNDRPMIESSLNSFILLQFLQQRAELMCSVSQLEIEQNYWNFVINLLTTPIGVWLSGISKDTTKKNFINWDHTKTKMNIERRHQIIKHKLINAKNQLKIHLKQSYSWYWQLGNKNSKDHIIKILSNGLHVLVQNSLYYFRLNFEQKNNLTEI